MTFATLKTRIAEAGLEWNDCVPSNWYDLDSRSWKDSDTVPEALLHYVGIGGRNHVPDVEAPQPRWSVDDSIKDDGYLRTDGAGASYHVFSDGSILYTNNAEEEVWSDYQDFVRELLDGSSLSAMDRALLAEYAGTEEEAMQLT